MKSAIPAPYICHFFCSKRSFSWLQAFFAAISCFFEEVEACSFAGPHSYLLLWRKNLHQRLFLFIFSVSLSKVYIFPWNFFSLGLLTDVDFSFLAYLSLVLHDTICGALTRETHYNRPSQPKTEKILTLKTQTIAVYLAS